VAKTYGNTSATEHKIEEFAEVCIAKTGAALWSVVVANVSGVDRRDDREGRPV
jgi:hypothetical protein